MGGGANPTGVQYGLNTIWVDNSTDPTNVYSAFQVADYQTGNAIGIAFNSYSPYYAASTPVLNGGGNWNSSDVTLGLRSDGVMDVWKPTQFKESVQITGSLNLSGTLSASLQEGYVWVGGVGNRVVTAPTSSFGGGGGGASFPYTGSAVITGSLAVTGSMSGYVNALTITSQTASLNFNDGNFFTLQLVSGSITHLTATNIKPGQTVNLLVKMDAVAGITASSGSLTFSPTFKFAGGIDYTPTRITGSQDLVSFVTFDTTQVLAAQVKNLS